MNGTGPGRVHRIGIIGASGYAGMEATRILAHHRQGEVGLVASDRWQDEPVEKRLGPLGPTGAPRHAPLEPALERAAQCPAGLLATPPHASPQPVPQRL